MASYDDTATVSGSVVSFSNGADEVPIKSWDVEIAPTLTGKSAVECTQTGKNICNVAPWVRDTTFYGSNWAEMVTFLNTLPVGNYSVSYDYEITALTGSSIDVAYSPYIRALVNGSYVNVTPYSAPQTDSSPTVGKTYHCTASFSITSQTAGNVANFYLYCGQSGIKVAEVTVKNAMVELGSTPSSYEAYNGTTHTANLGRTIYGGTADVVNGTGRETYKGYTLDNLTWSGGNVQGNWCWYVVLTDDGLKLPENSAIFEGICDNYVPIRYNGVGGTVNTIALRSTGYLYVNNGSNTITPTGNVTIALSTPTNFTFTGQEINTRLGYNAFWSEQGNTELTYYKSGYGFTSVTVHKETPDGEPVVQTVKFHRIVYEGEVDAVRGTGKVSIGESGTEYDPPETFTFEPISISTDEGENTLFANEGDSAITYRKAVD